MSEARRIVLWGKQNCSKCEQVRSYLQANRLDYDTIDVEAHDSLRDVLEKKYGRRSVPVIEIGDSSRYRAVFGVDLPGLKEALEER